MATVILKNGPCDPREVEMAVTIDASVVWVRPMPFEVEDVYAVVDRFIDETTVTHAWAEYLHTTGTRKQVDAYRQTLIRLGTGRAFRVKRERKDAYVH